MTNLALNFNNRNFGILLSENLKTTDFRTSNINSESLAYEDLTLDFDNAGIVLEANENITIDDYEYIELLGVDQAIDIA